MSCKRNPEFVLFLIGAIILIVFLALVLFRGQQIKEEKVLAKMEWYDGR